MVENKQNDLVPSQDELLSYFNLAHLSDEQKHEVLQGMTEHFSDLIIDTLLDSISEQQARDLENALQMDPVSLSQKVQELSSHIPGLNAKIQITIARELEVLKTGFEQIKK